MKVCEIFLSIQGESSFAGFPCVFVRLTGCNLRCSYCDTAYAFEEGTDIELSEIRDKVKSFEIKIVEITGGEPLLQKETYILMRSLLDDGFRVLLETNGSMNIESLDNRVNVVLDLKTPSSNMSEKMYMRNLELLSEKDDLKFVLSDREDYDWASDLIKKYELTEKTNVLLSPVFNVLDPAVLSGWMLNDRLDVRLNLQLHKYIFKTGERGV